MTRALVVTHTEHEGPGLLADWLAAAGVEVDVVAPYAGDRLPATTPGTHRALIVMGGPMSANDDDSCPWLGATKKLMRDAVDRSVPTLGICLGGQLLAAACGGRVLPGAAGPELGAGLLAKRDVAASDSLFAGVPFTPDVIQWHWDEIAELPPGSVLLASSSRYPNQAFRLGTSAWGLQFHLETPPEMVSTWARQDADRARAAGLDPDQVLRRALAVLPDVEVAWRPAVERFAALAHRRD
ncbi:MAG: type 1 glutamine amidotransferase [Actinomycetota bacterium]|nr:type 1 glutamine amidotransferase [Actinomycetota bacterium]